MRIFSLCLLSNNELLAANGSTGPDVHELPVLKPRYL